MSGQQGGLVTYTVRGHVMTWASSTGVSELSPFKATCDCGMVALGHRRATSEDVASVPEPGRCTDRHGSLVDELTCRLSTLERERDDARRWAVRLEQEIAENRNHRNLGADRMAAQILDELTECGTVQCEDPGDALVEYLAEVAYEAWHDYWTINMDGRVAQIWSSYPDQHPIKRAERAVARAVIAAYRGAMRDE